MTCYAELSEWRGSKGDVRQVSLPARWQSEMGINVWQSWQYKSTWRIALYYREYDNEGKYIVAWSMYVIWE